MILKGREQGQWAKLINVGADYEMALIASRLAEFNIPVQRKSKGSGAYTDILMGHSLTGYDIYVPANRLEEAKEILADVEPLGTESDALTEAELDEIVNIDVISEAENQAGGESDGYILNHRSFFKELFILIIVVPTVLGLLYMLIK